jgi:glycosyl hydrolase family 106( putative alpha-L-rhamnosidase)
MGDGIRTDVQAARDRERTAFEHPTREFGILPFWFLNGELDPDEMRWQLGELAAKGMQGVILHGRYGLEMPYLSGRYLERVKFAADEARGLGLAVWIYDEMNWPSGTADKRVLKARPDLAQRYIECVSFTVEGPWFMFLTGEDSRYLDFQRSVPVAAFAIGERHEVIDLTPNLSFGKVVPWEVPPGVWRLAYIVEKRADYYIDALDPEATKAFIELGYAPYLQALNGDATAPLGGSHAAVTGFYSDEPAMHYFLTASDNAILPWTKDMFRQFAERNGYALRPRLADLFYDVRADSARVRHDFFNTITELYTNAYYRQLRDWCRSHGVAFTAHLLYEEWLRRMVRVEGNLFRHYENMDVVAVDHLYPVIGSREHPDQHVAMKVASSAAHQFGSERLICESFGGIFMDATMQRMKWIADWEYVLGVNLLNPHGFHYTLEGPRKRDWPPSQFYQYPYWRHYQKLNDYISRLSRLLSGGRHMARVAVLWPINAMFATYRPQERDRLGERIEQDFNALTDLLLRLHVEFDYLDEDVLARASIRNGTVIVGTEAYEAVVVPPMAHCRLSTVTRLEELVAGGGKVLGMVLLPGQGFGPDGQVDLAARLQALFGVDPPATASSGQTTGVRIDTRRHEGGGIAAFIAAASVALPDRPADAPAVPAPERDAEPPATQKIRDPQATAVADAIASVLAELVPAGIEIGSDELFCLHRCKDGQDLFFVVNPTFTEQGASVGLPGDVDPVLWDPSTGQERIAAPSMVVDGWTRFHLNLPPAGSVVLLPRPASTVRVTRSDVQVELATKDEVRGHGPLASATVTVVRDGVEYHLTSGGGPAPPAPIVLDEDWEFSAEQPNALVMERWLAREESVGASGVGLFCGLDVDESDWRAVGHGAWANQLPAEPDRPWPIPVWYRVTFGIEVPPPNLHLVLDGFAGDDVRLFLNGEPVRRKPQRSPFDSQMRWVDISSSARPGRNVLAARMLITGPAGGLTDRLKLAGHFAVGEEPDGPRLIRPSGTARPESWVTQGYPFYSGVGVYRRRFTMPERLAGTRLFLDVPMRDDCLEVIVNSRPAGVFLWGPYMTDVTDLIRAGENEIELRIANTLSNFLNADRRASGLAGPPRIITHREFVFTLGPTATGRKRHER